MANHGGRITRKSYALILLRASDRSWAGTDHPKSHLRKGRCIAEQDDVSPARWIIRETQPKPFPYHATKCVASIGQVTQPILSPPLGCEALAASLCGFLGSHWSRSPLQLVNILEHFGNSSIRRRWNFLIELNLFVKRSRELFAFHDWDMTLQRQPTNPLRQSPRPLGHHHGRRHGLRVIFECDGQLRRIGHDHVSVWNRV